MPLNSIWLDFRLNELSIESKNTQNGVLKKELCELQAMKKSVTSALAAVAITTGFCHFRTSYKLKIVSRYIWMDFRLKGLSIEFNNTQIEFRTKKLWPSEVVDKSRKICSGEQYPRLGVP